MKRKRWLTAAVVLALVVLVGYALAQDDADAPFFGPGPGFMGPGFMGGPGGPMNGLPDLNLTDDQEARLVDIHSGLIKEQLPIRKKLKKLREEMKGLQTADKIDESRIRKLLKQISGFKADMMINRLNTYKEAKAVLTPDQLEKLGDGPIPFFGPCLGYGPGSPMCGPGWGRPGPGGPDWGGHGVRGGRPWYRGHRW